MAELTSDRTGALVFPSSRTLPAGRVVRAAGAVRSPAATPTA